MKYLDDTGLEHLWQKTKDLVSQNKGGSSEYGDIKYFGRIYGNAWGLNTQTVISDGIVATGSGGSIVINTPGRYRVNNMMGPVFGTFNITVSTSHGTSFKLIPGRPFTLDVSGSTATIKLAVTGSSTSVSEFWVWIEKMDDDSPFVEFYANAFNTMTLYDYNNVSVAQSGNQYLFTFQQPGTYLIEFYPGSTDSSYMFNGTFEMRGINLSEFLFKIKNSGDNVAIYGNQYYGNWSSSFFHIRKVV